MEAKLNQRHLLSLCADNLCFKIDGSVKIDKVTSNKVDLCVSRERKSKKNIKAKVDRIIKTCLTHTKFHVKKVVISDKKKK